MSVAEVFKHHRILGLISKPETPVPPLVGAIKAVAEVIILNSRITEIKDVEEATGEKFQSPQEAYEDCF